MEQKPVSNSENQETSGSASPSVNMEEYLKMKEQFEKTTGMTIEQFFEMQRKAEEQKRQQLQLQLKEIETEIATLQVKRSEIIKQLGINKTPRTRTGTTGNSDTTNLKFALDGIEFSASEIARQLGLYKASPVNWKRVFLSVLSGNNGGFSTDVAEKIRERVSIIQ